MTFTDMLLIVDIPCRPIENLMTLLTMFSPAFLCNFCSCVQVSVLVHKLVEATTYSCHCICYLFLPQGLFFSRAEMDVFLHSATLKALFWEMCPIWTRQSMCVTLIVGPVSSFQLEESFTSEQLKNFTLDTGAFGSDWRGASLTRYFEMCRMDSSVLGVDNSHIFIFQWCKSGTPWRKYVSKHSKERNILKIPFGEINSLTRL